MEPPRQHPTQHPKSEATPGDPSTKTYRVGCVSYLNAKPLIDGLDAEPGVSVRADVPARLLSDLEAGLVDVALCPVIDYFASASELELVPVGGIGCEGPTLTVRLYSQVPIDQIKTLHVDTDSHTSVALSRVLLAESFGIQPRIVEYHARERVAEGKIDESPEAMLLIGDKVVTGSPLAVRYPYQLDLGEGWHELTGLPFVFATWMTKRGTDLGDLPARLSARLERNLPQRVLIAERYASAHGWPIELAEHYLIDVLRYRVGRLELEAIGRFGRLAHRHGLVAAERDVVLHGEADQR